MRLDKHNGKLLDAEFIASPNFDEREAGAEPEVLIIHCISLPPGCYGGNEVADFFCNQLDNKADPYFTEIAHLQVSTHFYIHRNGTLQQFVTTDKRAWHAGESECLGRCAVNNFSIGIELEGLDTDPAGFTDKQYQVLTELSQCLINSYPLMSKDKIFGHNDIAPDRKADPGEYFDWARYKDNL